MQDFGSNLTRAAYLEKLGRVVEAVDAYIRLDQIHDAVRVALPSRNRKALQMCSKAVLNCLWSSCSYGSRVGEEKGKAMDFLNLAGRMDKSHMSNFDRDHVSCP